MSAVLPTQAPTTAVGGMVGASPEEVPEELKQAVLIQLNEFKDNSEELLRFPTSFEKNERSFINQSARKMGLLSKTVGKNSNKHVVVSRNLELAQASPWPLTLQHHSKHQIQNLLRDLPVRPNELADIQVQVELPAGSQQQISTAPNDQKFKDHNRRQMGKLCNSSTVATVPSRPLTNDVNYLEARQRLPIWNKKEQILRTIQENQVTIICGDTGCGKTTQVPQYILEDATNRQVPCFMYVTQPRRIAAIAAAERVSQERGERVGTSVGYQIRLEYRSTQKTVLTYCTNSVLLRALMLAGPHESLEQVTHIVIDEIHERDRYSDFLLIVLHDILPLRPYLRLVLMSATMDCKKFQEYFKNAPVVPVRSSTNNVEALFLEDVLRSTKYHEHIKDKVMTTEERVYRTSIDAVTNHTKRMKQGNPHSGLGGRFAQLGLGGEMDPQFYPEGYEMSSDETFREILGLGDQGDSVDSSMEVWTMEPMDITMDNAREHFTEKEFAQILHFIMNESVGVDYHHTTSLMTPLMIAASNGCVEAVQKLLDLGADPNLKDLQGMTCFMHGKAYPDVLKMLEEHSSHLVSGKHDSKEETKIIDEEEVKDILTSYYDIVDSSRVDLDLIFYLISLIMDCDQDGSVLVFLPAYDDIMRLRSMLMQDQKIIHRVQIFMLHSSMQPFEQRKVFRKPPYGIRKVILSTNIAETSLTIDDVTFVIDSGKVKERYHDLDQGVIKFQNEWISKSSAVHRRGRAGRVRPGVCYHLFSRKRYTMFQEHTEPELMRYPLSELALNCKVLAPHNMPIPEFLGKCLQSPSASSLKHSLSELTTMEALTPWEELTTTGKHLAELPIDPQLGKVVLYSVVLKCLDPVLTIVCSLAYTDPFLKPTSQKLKVSALQARRRFSINSQSDHLSSLKAFLGWQKARANGWENQFCEKNFLSLATLEMIEGLRAQIIAQLRSMGFIRQVNNKGGVDIRNLNDNSDKWHVVKACLVGGLYPKLARADRAKSCLTSAKHSTVQFHNDSAMNPATLGTVPRAEIAKQSIEGLRSDWVVYDEITDHKGVVSARCCTVVSAVTVALCAGPTGSPEETEVEEAAEEVHSSTVLQLDDWISIELQSADQATAIKQLRLKFHALFQRRLKTPFSQLTQVDASILRCVVSILKQEEEPLNLTQPVGISQRPFRPYDHAYHTRYHMPSVVHSFNHHDDNVNEFDQIKQWQPLPQQSFITYNNNKPGRPYDNQIIYQENKPPFPNQLPMPQFPPKLPPAAAGYTPYTATDDQYYNQGQPRNEVYYTQGPQPVVSEPSRYFIMKCGNQRNIDNSVQTNYWYTSVSSEKKLNSAFAECKHVILIFSVQTSGHFQGYARMMSAVTPYKDANNGGVVRIEWIKRANLPFQRCHHLYNPWNENRKVQIARDGQELEPSIGEGLVRLWDELPAPYQRPFYPPARPLAPLATNYQYDNNYNAMGKPM